MEKRLTLLMAILLLGTSVGGCERMGHSTKRAWWDVRMILAAPINIPLSVGKAIGEDLTSPPWGLNQLKALTWTPIHATLRHGAYLVFHSLDLAAYPLYLLFGPGLHPLYETDTFPFPIDADNERELWRKLGDAAGVVIVGTYKALMVAGLVILNILTMGLLL